MNSVEIFRKIAEKEKLPDDIKLLDDIDTMKDDYKIYYCANIKEKLFECNNQLIYIKGGGFGMNYRYCQSCYSKWNDLKKNNFKNNLKRFS